MRNVTSTRHAVWCHLVVAVPRRDHSGMATSRPLSQEDGWRIETGDMLARREADGRFITIM